MASPLRARRWRSPISPPSFRAPTLTLRYGRSLITAYATTLAVGEGALLLTAGLLHIGGAGPALWLTPGLILAGAGLGLAITPLTTTVLAHVDPQRVGALAGVLSTTQQLGNSIGVAVTAVIFSGLLAVAALSRLLRRRRKRRGHDRARPRTRQAPDHGERSVSLAGAPDWRSVPSPR